ncbi:MAG: hypothetical protein J7M38_01420, partial [Armatimonadetes bacterium]|nr:hypothetical protein [Armatimonadota bacterium]
MRNRYILAALAAVLLIALAGWCDDLEPPWEVRTFIAPTTNSTYTQNMSVVRKEWVCPICGYSTHVAPYNSGGNSFDGCPDPWGLGGHGTSLGEDNARLVHASPEERVCGHVSARQATPVMIGRPFHPGEPDPMSASDWNDNPAPWVNPTAANASSYVHVRAAGIYSDYYSTWGVTEYLLDPADPDNKVRFLVIEPGATRAMASAADITEVADPDNAAAPNQWTIHVNPYRVSNGDQWYVRQHEETNAAGNTTVLRIEVYSKLYGADFSMDSATDPNVDLTRFRNENGCRVISDSGAVVVECPRMLTGNNQSATYVLGFTIASNTQTLPCPEEVDYDDVAGCGDLYPGLSEPDFTTNINVALPTKQAWMVPTTPGSIVGYAGTDLPVQEKVANGNFTSNQCWPYRIPAGATGLGRVILEWSDSVATHLHRQSPSWGTFYYRNDDATDSDNPGAEWYYHADLYLGNGSHPDMEYVHICNYDVARRDPIEKNSGDRAYYYMVDCAFLSTRSDVELTGDIW